MTIQSNLQSNTEKSYVLVASTRNVLSRKGARIRVNPDISARAKRSRIKK